MSEIQPFTFPTTGQAVRTLLVDGEPYLCHTDVCQLLQHSNPSVAIRLVDEDDRRLIDLAQSDIYALKRGVPGNGQTWFVNESGFYTLAFASRAAGAQQLRRWVTHEVLPSIRKTGSYSLPREYTRLELIDMARESEIARIEAENRAAAAECQVLELAPAARAWDELSEAAGDYSVREAAQVLDRDPRISTGQKRLFEYLRTIGWIDRHNTPYQAQINLGRLCLRARSYEHPNRDELVATQQVRVTAKGLGELHRLLGGAAQLPALVSEGVAA